MNINRGLRVNFIELIFFFKGSGIKEDIIKMGTIFNWDKEYFTMDEVRS